MHRVSKFVTLQLEVVVQILQLLAKFQIISVVRQDYLQKYKSYKDINYEMQAQKL